MFLVGSLRSGLAQVVNQGAGLQTAGHRAYSGLCREGVQVFGSQLQVFKDQVDPGESFVVVVTPARRHEASAILRAFGRAEFRPVRVQSPFSDVESAMCFRPHRLRGGNRLIRCFSRPGFQISRHVSQRQY